MKTSSSTSSSTSSHHERTTVSSSTVSGGYSRVGDGGRWRGVSVGESSADGARLVARWERVDVVRRVSGAACVASDARACICICIFYIYIHIYPVRDVCLVKCVCYEEKIYGIGDLWSGGAYLGVARVPFITFRRFDSAGLRCSSAKPSCDEPHSATATVRPPRAKALGNTLRRRAKFATVRPTMGIPCVADPGSTPGVCDGAENMEADMDGRTRADSSEVSMSRRFESVRLPPGQSCPEPMSCGGRWALSFATKVAPGVVTPALDRSGSHRRLGCSAGGAGSIPARSVRTTEVSFHFLRVSASLMVVSGYFACRMGVVRHCHSHPADAKQLASSDTLRRAVGQLRDVVPRGGSRTRHVRPGVDDGRPSLCTASVTGGSSILPASIFGLVAKLGKHTTEAGAIGGSSPSQSMQTTGLTHVRVSATEPIPGSPHGLRSRVMMTRVYRRVSSPRDADERTTLSTWACSSMAEHLCMSAGGWLVRVHPGPCAGERSINTQETS